MPSLKAVLLSHPCEDHHDARVRSDYFRPLRVGLLPGRIGQTRGRPCLNSRWTRTMESLNSTRRFNPCLRPRERKSRPTSRRSIALRPELSMVNSNRGITNLHVPSDTIIDASMPVIVRDGGRTWGPDTELHDTIAMIPDRSYATLYQSIIEDCQEHGAFDPSTIGSVANVGLMAQAAEEYGSHDKTFKAPGNGTIRVVDASGATLTGTALSKKTISSGCARPQTRRFRTGSSLESIGPGSPARHPSFGWTRTGLTTLS